MKNKMSFLDSGGCGRWMRESAHKGRGKTDSTERVGKYNMKESSYKSYDELPLFLNAKTVAKVLGVSPSSGYELMHEPDFPVLKIGSRLVVPKEKFAEWVSQHTQGGAD